MRVLTLFKGKRADQGETRVWKDGKTRKKVGKKWVIVEGGQKTEARHLADSWRRSKKLFDYSLTTNLGDEIDKVLQGRGIESFDQLVEEIEQGPADAAHRIYKEAVDNIRSALATPGDKKAAIDLFGRSLIILKDQYSVKPKARLTVTKTSKKGKKYRAYEEGKHTTELPPIKPSAAKAEQAKMGGWSVTGKLTTAHVKKMLQSGAATVISGEPKENKPWVLPKKAEDMEQKYKSDHLLIRVKQVDKKKQRTRATAKVEIKIPYAFAKAFLLNQIESTRTKNYLIFRMERSQGYRNYMEKYGA
jgi:hypothetical protein